MNIIIADNTKRATIAFTTMGVLLILVGFFQSWSLALYMINTSIILAVMALGVNIQWGYAGLFNVGVMGFAALGGAAAMLVSVPPVYQAWSAGGTNLGISVFILAVSSAITYYIYRRTRGKRFGNLILATFIITAFFLFRVFFDSAVSLIESVEPSKTGYLGGLGLPIIFSWIIGGIFAAGVAWLIGKITLGLRSDYLAIATLGISEIIVSMLKNEEWLTRGVKNVTNLPRPVPYEINLQNNEIFIGLIEWINSAALSGFSGIERAALLQEMVVEGSSIFVKLCYTAWFLAVLAIIFILCALALNSPWGRMIRAIRDNEVAANAMGKNVTNYHLQIFILGSAVIGIAGAMLTTLEGQFTPASYNPLRYTFIIWVMVVIGGAGNNMGSVIGAFIIWFIWIEAEEMGSWFMDIGTSWMDSTNPIRVHLIENAKHMRLFLMGLVLLLMLRFSPGGILPEYLKKPLAETGK